MSISSRIVLVLSLTVSLGACATEKYAGCPVLTDSAHEQGTATLVGTVLLDNVGEETTRGLPTHFITWDVKPTRILSNSLGQIPDTLKVISSWHEFTPTNDIIDRSGGYVETGTTSIMRIRKRVKRLTQDADYEIVASEVCAELPRTNSK